LLQLQVSRTPRDIQPGEEQAVYVDDQLARDLRPYRQSIHLSGTVTPPLRHPFFPSCGFQPPLSAGEALPLRFVGGTCHEVQATARFLELTDDAATSAKVEVNCPVR
jgi:hypothetical protein